MKKYKYEDFNFDCKIEVDLTDICKPYFKYIEERVKHLSEQDNIVDFTKDYKMLWINEVMEWWYEHRMKGSFIPFTIGSYISADGRVISHNHKTMVVTEREQMYKFFSYHLLHIIKKYNLKSIDIMNSLKNNRKIIESKNNEYNLYMISKSIEYFINQDFIASTYISIPIIESILRDLCRTHDINIIKKEEGKYENFQCLDNIIDLLFKNKILPKDFKLFLKDFLLNEKNGGSNIRNNLFHGVPINIDDFYQFSGTCIYILIKIIGI